MTSDRILALLIVGFFSAGVGALSLIVVTRDFRWEPLLVAGALFGMYVTLLFYAGQHGRLGMVPMRWPW